MEPSVTPGEVWGCHTVDTCDSDCASLKAGDTEDTVLTYSVSWDLYAEVSSNPGDDDNSVQQSQLDFLNLCCQVMSTRTANVYGLQVPVGTHFHLDEWDSQLQGYHDKEVTHFLQYGWLVN